MSPATPVSPAPPVNRALAGPGTPGTRRPGWDVYYSIILVGVLVLVIAVQARQDWPAAGLAISCAALAAMAPWYLLHRRTLHYGDGSLARGLIYLAGLWILFIIASSQGSSSLGAAGAWPAVLPGRPVPLGGRCRRRPQPTPVALALINGAGAGELTSLIASAVLTVAFSVAFGLWVFRIIAQSHDRASLIAELSQTRAELAQANRRPACWPSGSGWPARSTTRWPRASPASSCCSRRPTRMLGPEPAAAREHLALALQTARENLAEARALVAALAPADLEPGALDGALRRLTDAVPGHLGPPAELRGDRPGRAAAQARRGHAAPGRPGGAGQRAPARRGPGRCRSGLRYGEGQVGLEVTDDGVGFDPGQPGGGYGLPGMRARAEEAGGRLEVRSSPGCGTTVRVVVPVDAPGAQAGTP